ncbi:MAG: hypothetical protein IPJ40_06005 [Saprospirales bacterium]|nr:hypothetical protein [Saprospirales bacterium]
MRIIGSIDHPEWKITVFKMDNRISLKLEAGMCEQTYKFRTGEGMESLEDVQRLVDAAFLKAVGLQFASMHQTQVGALSRSIQAGEDEFDEII